METAFLFDSAPLPGVGLRRVRSITDVDDNDDEGDDEGGDEQKCVCVCVCVYVSVKVCSFFVCMN